DVVEACAQLGETVVPCLQLWIILLEFIERPLELDDSPQPELVPVIFGTRPLEMVERRLMIVPVVENVREIDPCFGVLAVELQCPAQRRNGAVVVSEPVTRVPHAR